MLKTDILVIGAGAAGLSFAIRAAERFPKRQVLVLNKSAGSEASRLAQGGVAAVMNHAFDNPERHVNDTLKAGGGLCDQRAAEVLAAESPQRIADLINWGAKFDGLPSKPDLGLEGGHTAKRIVHRGDTTGREIMRVLFARTKNFQNIEITDRFFAADLITHSGDQKTCAGVWLYDRVKEKFIPCLAGATLLATGGIGALFPATTNPPAATGDGIAMAHRAGVAVMDMEFIQYHPTVLYDKQSERRLLLTEALRGAGALLRNDKGEPFMKRYDIRADLAPRDVVSRAIMQEVSAHRNTHVFLDCTVVAADRLRNEFSMVYHECMRRGIDLSKQWAPVQPAMHYLCGGIATDLCGRTSLRGLYAAGECARTGLHGANRLASNSLAEALVFGKNTADNIVVNDVDDKPIIQDYRMPALACYAPDKLRHMMRAAGVTSSYDELTSAALALQNLRESVAGIGLNRINTPDLLEFRNMMDVAALVLEYSLKRRVNVGTFWNVDLARDSVELDKSRPAV